MDLPIKDSEIAVAPAHAHMPDDVLPQQPSFDYAITLQKLRELAKDVVARGANVTAISDAQRPEFRQAWDTILLDQSFRYAASASPHYERVLAEAGLTNGLAQAEDIQKLPCTRKADIVADHRAFLSRHAPAEEFSCTSGTTSERLTLYRTKNEIASQILIGLLRSHEPHQSPGIALRIVPAMRRLLSRKSEGQFLDLDTGKTALPGKDRLLFVYSQRDNGMLWFDSTDHLTQVIWDSYDLQRLRKQIDQIHCTPPFIFNVITQKLLERGIDPSTSGVKDIILTGGPVTGRERRLVEKHWKARFKTSFSCTEVCCEAPECPLHPGLYHTWLTSFSEVLDTKTFQPVRPGGHGLLALTSYYPFQQATPLIRYLTDDIVEAVDGMCACGASGPSFRFVGRTKHCIDLSDLCDRGWFLGSHAVLEAVSDIDQIPADPAPRFLLSRKDIGDATILSVEIESNYHRTFDVAATSQLIASRLATHVSDHAPLLQEREIRIEAVLRNKGSMVDFFSLYPAR